MSLMWQLRQNYCLFCTSIYCRTNVQAFPTFLASHLVHKGRGDTYKHTVICLSFWPDSQGLPDCLLVWWPYIWNREGVENHKNHRAFLPLSSTTTTPRGMNTVLQWLFNTLISDLFFTAELFIKNLNFPSSLRLFLHSCCWMSRQWHIFQLYRLY